MNTLLVIIIYILQIQPSTEEYITTYNILEDHDNYIVSYNTLDQNDNFVFEEQE